MIKKKSKNLRGLTTRRLRIQLQLNRLNACTEWYNNNNPKNDNINILKAERSSCLFIQTFPVKSHKHLLSLWKLICSEWLQRRIQTDVSGPDPGALGGDTPNWETRITILTQQLKLQMLPLVANGNESWATFRDWTVKTPIKHRQ